MFFKFFIMKKVLFFSVFFCFYFYSFAQVQDDMCTINDSNMVENLLSCPEKSNFQVNTISEDPMSYWEFKQKVKLEKGTFLEVGTLAYQKYKSYNAMKWSGVALLATGFALAVPVGIPLYLCLWDVYSYYDYTGVGHIWVQNDIPGIVCMSVGGGLMVAGTVLLGCMNSQLQQSYHYYVHGQKQSVSLNWHPTFGTDYAGVGLRMRF